MFVVLGRARPQYIGILSLGFANYSTANNLKKVASILGCRVGDFFEDEGGPASGAATMEEPTSPEPEQKSGPASSVLEGSGGVRPQSVQGRGFDGSGGLVCRCPHCGGAVALGLLPVGVFGDAKIK